MTDQPTPAPADLRQRVAEALAAKIDGTQGCANRYRLADAVLAVVQPELDRLAALLDAESRTLAEVDQRCDRYVAELAALREVARGYCPHCGRGDASPTAQQWEEQKQRADQVEELLRIAHDTSNRSEAERARAVQRAETAERDAGIYHNRLTRLTGGYAEQFRRLEAAEAALDKVRALRDDLCGVTGARYIADALDKIVGDEPAPAHDAGPSVAECADADRKWPLEKEGQ